MNIEYKVGDIILLCRNYQEYLEEVEIDEIAENIKCLKIDGVWYEETDVAPKIKQVIGRATYKRGLFGTKRTVTYASSQTRMIKTKVKI